MDSATQIAVGKVVHVNSFWDKTANNIYTVYTIQSNALLKQNSPFPYLDVIVPGGIIGDEAQIFSPSLSIEMQQTYLFFLTPSSIALANTSPSFHPSYELYGYAQGYLPLKQGEFYDHFGEKPIQYQTLVKYIQNRTSFAPILTYSSPTSTPASRLGNRPNESISRNSITLTNGNGIPTNIFYGGRIEPEQDLIIQGTGFGTTIGNIQFASADNGAQDFMTFPKPSDIISWTDTQIRVKIPHRAGSGILQVYHQNNTLLGEQAIIIEWAIKPIYSTYKNFSTSTRQFINFINQDTKGGYTLQYNLPSGLAINEPAKAAFERALESWQCATGIHFTIGDNYTNEYSKNDDVCSIMFQEEMPVGVVAMTSSRYKASGSTGCDLFNTTWYLREFDLLFADPNNMLAGLSWSFDTDLTTTYEFDFETIVLHELGHAHGLGHINTFEASMYYAIQNGVTKRTLTNQDIEAGLYQMERSKAENCIFSKLPMQEHPNFCGSQFHQAPSTKLKVFLEGYYDEDLEEMRTDLREKELLPLAQPFNKAPFNYDGSEQLSTTPATMVDWLLIGVRDTNNYQTIICEKAAILHSDGTITTVNNSEIISFDCVNLGTYYISITHHNHLSIVSSTPIVLDETAYIDFTTDVNTALGKEQLKAIGNHLFLYSGDFDCNGIINNEDYNLWKISGAAINIYTQADADGNGIINSLDYNLWKTNRSKIGMMSEH